MERDFFRIGDTPIVRITSSSPEEAQMEDGPLPCREDWPEGYQIDVVKRIEKGRIVRYVGLAKVGERLPLPGDEKPQPQPAPKGIEVPPVVKKQDKETDQEHDNRLEVMAARNGIDVTPAWRRRSRTARMADVATAMKLKREMPEMVNGHLVK